MPDKRKLLEILEPSKKTKIEGQISQVSLEAQTNITNNNQSAQSRTPLGSFENVPLPILAKILQYLSPFSIINMAKLNKILHRLIQNLDLYGAKKENNPNSFYNQATENLKLIIPIIAELESLRFEKENISLWFKGVNIESKVDVSIFKRFIDTSKELLNPQVQNYAYGTAEQRNHLYEARHALINCLEYFLTKSGKIPLQIDGLPHERRIHSLMLLVFAQGPTQEPNFLEALKNLSPFIIYILAIIAPLSSQNSYRQVLLREAYNSLNITQHLYFKGMPINNSQLRASWAAKIPQASQKQLDSLVTAFRNIVFLPSSIANCAKSLNSDQLDSLITILENTEVAHSLLVSKVNFPEMVKFWEVSIPLQGNKEVTQTNFFKVLCKSRALLYFILKTANSLLVDLTTFAKTYAESIGKIYKLNMQGLNKITKEEIEALFPKSALPQDEMKPKPQLSNTSYNMMLANVPAGMVTHENNTGINTSQFNSVLLAANLTTPSSISSNNNANNGNTPAPK